MKKSKFLKPFSFASLALLMGATGVFAFAPLGASPSVAGASEMVESTTSGLGLDPKNDPVVYTTESGLDIRFGGATILGGGNEESDSLNVPITETTSGELQGCFYTTMGTYNSKSINWIIVGHNLTSTSGSSLEYKKLSEWQSKTNVSPTYKYFFDNVYENSTPAGTTVKNDGVLDDLTARSVTATFQGNGFEIIPKFSTLPTNCVLALSESILCNSIWCNTSTTGPCYYLQNTLTSIYNNGGFSTFVNNGTLIYNATFSNTVNGTTNYLFPLKQAHAQALIDGGLNLIAKNSSGTAAHWWLCEFQGTYSADVKYWRAYAVYANGTIGGCNFYNNWSAGGYSQYTGGEGVRPAMVMKLK